VSFDVNNTPPRILLGRVYVIMAVLGSLTVAVPELLNYFLSVHISTGVLPFLVLAATGAWATHISSIGYGAVGGALVGFALSLVGGVVYVIIRLPDAGDAARLILSSVVITTVLGSAFGTLGGLPFWFWEFRRRRT
jgi:hypothetical protein